MSGHTPGPWRLSHSGYANAPFAILSSVREPQWKSKHPYIACDVIGEVFQDESPKHKEQEANARLIAAAPELLAALRKLKALAVEKGLWEFGEVYAAEKAIAKAEGRS